VVGVGWGDQLGRAWEPAMVGRSLVCIPLVLVFDCLVFPSSDFFHTTHCLLISSLAARCLAANYAIDGVRLSAGRQTACTLW